MNIALLGFGKMGQLIKKLALEKGHCIVDIANNTKEVESIQFQNVDISIDFSTPNSAFHNITTALKNNTPVVSGTTGWTEKLTLVNEIAIENDTSFLHASNFSVGVNIFFEINRILSQMINQQNTYKVSIDEIHHTEKLDTPSGTAISLQSHFQQHVPINSQRIHNIIGTHSVNYTSEIDTISIQHEAHNRNGFANGAIMAAEWIVDKKGVFTMRDILNFNQTL